MKNLEIEYKSLILDVNGEKQIRLPLPVFNPYMYKVYGNELAQAAGVSIGEISALLCEKAVLDVKTGKVCTDAVSDEKITSVLAVEWLLKRHSPKRVGKYLMHALPIHSDERLLDHYARVLNRASRYAKLIELDAPYIIRYHEVRKLQEAVNALYYGFSAEEMDTEITVHESSQDKMCLWDIVSKELNLTEVD